MKFFFKLENNKEFNSETQAELVFPSCDTPKRLVFYLSKVFGLEQKWSISVPDLGTKCTLTVSPGAATPPRNALLVECNWMFHKWPTCQAPHFTDTCLEKHKLNPCFGMIPWRINSLQYCCLKNPMERGAWPASVHRAA